MNWNLLKLLVPSTGDPRVVFQNISKADAQATSRALADLFIYITIIVFAFCFIWVLVSIVRSLWRTWRYNSVVKNDDQAIESSKQSKLPLFQDFRRHLISIPSRDGLENELDRRTVDANEIFREQELGPKFLSSRLVLAAPSILTGIGVLGTFIGLQIGIGGLDLENLKKLEASIVPLIQGCSVAFSTSVWGIGLSLVLSFFEKCLAGFALGQVQKLQGRINGIVLRYVPEASMASLERSSQGTKEILTGLAVAIGDEMQKAIGRLGNEIKDSLENVVREGHGDLAEQSAKLMSEALTAELSNLKQQIGSMSDQFSEKFSGASDQLMESVGAFEPTVRILSETVNSAQNAVTEAVEKLNAHESVMEQMAAASTEVRQAAEAFMSMKETMRQSATQNENAAKAQLLASKANNIVAAKLEVAAERLPEIRQTIDDALRVIASLGEPIADLQTYLARLPEDQQAIQEQRDQSEERRNRMLLHMTGDLAEKVGAAAQQFAQVDGLADKLNVAATSLDEASNELAVFGSQVLDASKAQREASEMSRAAALSGERTAQSLEPLPGAFTGLISGLENAGNSVRSGAEAARNSYRELINLQEQSFRGAEVGLRAMKDRLQEIITQYGDQIEGQTRDLMTEWTNVVTECLRSYEAQTEDLQGYLDEIQEFLNNRIQDD